MTVPFYDLNRYSGLGRTMIFTDEDEITRENIESVVNKAFMAHQKNVIDEKFLTEYEQGKQGILERTKKIRP